MAGTCKCTSWLYCSFLAQCLVHWRHSKIFLLNEWMKEWKSGVIYSRDYRYPGISKYQQSQGYNPEYKNVNFSHHWFSRYLFAVENIFLFVVANAACCDPWSVESFYPHKRRMLVWYWSGWRRLEGSLACDGDIMCLKDPLNRLERWRIRHTVYQGRYRALDFVGPVNLTEQIQIEGP